MGLLTFNINRRIKWYTWYPIRRFLNVVIIPNVPVTIFRIWLYRLIGFKIGKKCFIGMKCYFDDKDPSMTIIKNGAIISYGVKMCVHGINQTHTQIIIEQGAYIGCGSILVAGKSGLKIGEKSIIGAGSVVISSIPNNLTAVGNPAKAVKYNINHK